MAENSKEESSNPQTGALTGTLLSKTEPDQQPKQLEQKPPDIKVPEQKPPEKKLPEQKSPDKDTKPPSESSSFRESVTSFVQWTCTDLFDFNPKYCLTVRGILNICHIVLSMLTMALMSSACQSEKDFKNGFYCKTSDTFLFVLGCSAFVMSLLFFLCCLLSANTERTLLKTTYEVSFYLLFFFFFLCGASNLTAKVVQRNEYSEVKEDHYGETLSGGIFGIMTSLTYFMSVVWFYLYNRRYGGQSNAANSSISPTPSPQLSAHQPTGSLKTKA